MDLFNCYFLFWGSFLNSCGCSVAKSKIPPDAFFSPLNGTEHGSQPPLTTRDRELVSVLEIRIEPWYGMHKTETKFIVAAIVLKTVIIIIFFIYILPAMSMQ